MPNPVQVTDLEARWRPLSDAEKTVAEALLGDAWAIILNRFPDMEDRLSESGSFAILEAVECAMVLRVLRNPDGKVQESIDDYAWTRDRSVSAGELYLSEREETLLSPGGAAGNQAFSVMPS